MRYPVFVTIKDKRTKSRNKEYLLCPITSLDGPAKTYWITISQINDLSSELVQKRFIQLQYPFPNWNDDLSCEDLHSWFQDHPISSNLTEMDEIIRRVMTRNPKRALFGRMRRKESHSNVFHSQGTIHSSRLNFYFINPSSDSHGSERSSSSPIVDHSKASHSFKRKLSSPQFWKSGTDTTIVEPKASPPKPSLHLSADALKAVQRRPSFSNSDSESSETISDVSCSDESSFLIQINEAFQTIESPAKLCKRVLHKILSFINATELYLIRTMKDSMVLEASLSIETTWSLLQRISLSQIQLFSMDIFNHAKSSGEAVILSNSQQVGASGSDYYVCNIPESVLCVPIFMRKNFMGSIYCAHDSRTDVFHEKYIPLLSLVISNLLGMINQVSQSAPITPRKSRKEKITANQISNTIMQDTMLVYDDSKRNWNAKFVAVSEEELLIFSSPFDTHPDITILSKVVKNVYVSSMKSRYKKISVSSWPDFPSNFKSKKSFVCIELEDESITWLAINSLKVAKIWFEVLLKNLEISHSLTDISTCDIPAKIRIDSNDVVMDEIIGRGGAAVVYSGQWNTNNVAIKVLYDTLDQSEVKDFFAEMKILHSLRHPNIISLMGGFINENGRPSIVFEYAERGSLTSVLYDPLLEISVEMKLKMMMQICRALQYLHSQETPIIHRDLKPANILVTENWNIKLADFGLARRCNSTMTLAQGTVKWMAPEILSNQPYTTKSDIYSLGFVLWEIIEQKAFFEEFKSNSQIEIQVVNHHARPPLSELFSLPLQEIISSCWHERPEKRPDVSSILHKLQAGNVISMP